MCRAIHRRCSSKSPEPQRGSSLTRSTAADVDRPTPPEPGRTESAGGPAGLRLVVALICAPPSVGGRLQDAMPGSAPWHARELAGRSAAGAGPERPDLSQGAGSGTNGGRSRGRRKRHQHSHAARAVPRTGRPSGGCADLGAPASRDLLVRRCSWVARSPRQSGSHFHAVDAWRPDHLAGPGRPRGAAAKAANTATPARHSRWFLRRLDPVPQEAAHVLHPIGRRGTRPFRLPPPCWAPPNAVLVWSAAAGFIGVR